MLLFLALTTSIYLSASTPTVPVLEPFEIVSKTPMTLSVPHEFDRDEAKKRVGYLLDYWSKRYSVQSAWQGDRVFLTGRIYGMQIRAFFDVEDARVSARAEDPGFLMRGTTRDYVEKKLKKYLSIDYRDF
jgi:hypothetical protein